MQVLKGQVLIRDDYRYIYLQFYLQNCDDFVTIFNSRNLSYPMIGTMDYFILCYENTTVN